MDCLRQSEKQKIISVEAGSSHDASGKLILESLVEGKVLDVKIAQMLHPNWAFQSLILKNVSPMNKVIIVDIN